MFQENGYEYRLFSLLDFPPAAILGFMTSFGCRYAHKADGLLCVTIRKPYDVMKSNNHRWKSAFETVVGRWCRRLRSGHEGTSVRLWQNSQWDNLVLNYFIYAILSLHIFTVTFIVSVEFLLKTIKLNLNFIVKMLNKANLRRIL